MITMTLFNIFLCFLVMNTILAEPKSDSENPTVRIKNGLTIIGERRTTFDEEKDYYSFRGIPFAKPPIGQLRFRSPMPLSDDFSNQTLIAFNDGPHCIRVSIFTDGSEDCLYLNVYTPNIPEQNASLLPVMVWIYGGAFVNGDGSYATFGPDIFLNEENVMIVTFNYREGIFGFLSTGDKAAPGNYGLKDQVLALKWVQENIRCFGGNPQQVTVFGESSGAVSISYLTQTNLTKGLFHRVILQSGSSLNPWALTRSTYSKALDAAAYFGIDVTTTQTLVDGLRDVDYEELHFYQTLVYVCTVLTSSKNGLPYGPTIEPSSPDAIVVNKSHEQLENGLFHEVPYIIGFNSLEAKTIVDAVSLPSIINRLLDRIPQRFRKILKIFKFVISFFWPILDINLAVPVVKVILMMFPSTSISASLNVNQTDVFAVSQAIAAYYCDFSNTHLHKFISENLFNRPILEAARLHSQKTPVYLYRFSYEGSLPLKQRALSVPGVGHGDELLYMWRWRKSFAEKNLTSSDLLTRKRLIKLWTNFAKIGNPTPEDDPLLQNVKWTLANENENLTYLDIGQSFSVGVNYDWDQFKFWNKLFNDYGNPPYSTY